MANLIPKTYLSSKRDKNIAKFYPKSSYRIKRDKNPAKVYTKSKIYLIRDNCPYANCQNTNEISLFRASLFALCTYYCEAWAECEFL